MNIIQSKESKVVNYTFASDAAGVATYNLHNNTPAGLYTGAYCSYSGTSQVSLQYSFDGSTWSALQVMTSGTAYVFKAPYPYIRINAVTIVGTDTIIMSMSW